MFGPSVCSSGVRLKHPWKVGLSHRRTAPGSCKSSPVFHLFMPPVSRQTNCQISQGSIPAPHVESSVDMLYMRDGR